MNKPTEELIQRLKEPDYQFYGCELSKGEADLVISALEKQIPKKPLGIENDNRYGCVLECFECKTILSGSEERPLYCPECGQKIDWSVKE